MFTVTEMQRFALRILQFYLNGIGNSSAIVYFKKPVRFREHLVIDLVVVIGLIIVEVKDYRSTIIIPWTENILMEIRNRVGNVLFPYTMNRIVFDIIGFEEWIFTERQQKMYLSNNLDAPSRHG
ncbi:uncharacterized protein OCT59_004999 [Rhizophagus irregularis]|uniref:uncharacterized protein n=1 Tax=Rhizophagus irregularis TaxID=588596 RepID=UPI003333C843|nr:hypothetical protein OCT59_004999 [Rhizophagus irregularis]